MKLNRLSKSVAMMLATATPLLLMNGGAPLAQQSQPLVDCMVGTAAYPTIQSAVDAPACATIQLPAGTIRENVTIRRSLTVRGAGPERTTVDASGKNSPVFAISSPPGVRQACDPPVFIVTLAGMTMTGGTGPGDTFVQRNGGAVSASPGVKLTVENSIVTGNSAYGNGGGISLVMGRLTVVDSVITRNTAFANPPPNPPDPNYIGGGGVRVAGCPSVLIVKNSVIKDNVSHGYGGGILVNVPTPLTILPGVPGVSIPGPNGTLVVVGSEITRNTAAEANGGGGIYGYRTDLTAFDSQIKHNYPDDLGQGPNP